MKRKICLMVSLLCILISLCIPAYADEGVAAQNRELADILLETYNEMIEAFNANCGEGYEYTIREEDRWLAWYSFHNMTEEEFEQYLQEQMEQVNESDNREEIDSEHTYFVAQSSDDQDAEHDRILRTLLLPYRNIIDAFNSEYGSEFTIRDEDGWYALYCFHQYSEEEFKEYLKEAYDTYLEEKDLEPVSEGAALIPEEDDTEVREKILAPYLEMIDRINEEFSVNLSIDQEDRWLAAIALSDLTAEEFYEYVHTAMEKTCQ